MSEARCPLVREIEEAAVRGSVEGASSEDWEAYITTSSARYRRLRAALEAAEEMAEWMSDPSCEHSNLGECRPCAILARYRAATRTETSMTHYPYPVDYLDDSFYDPCCQECNGRGFVIVCIDDLCHGQDECIHGDGEKTCPVCKGLGFV